MGEVSTEAVNGIIPEEELDAVLEELTGSLDLSQMEGFLNDHLREKIDLSALVSQIATEGLGALDLENIGELLLDSFFYELSMLRPMFLKMLLFTVLVSVAQRLLVTRVKYIADMGFLLIYTTLIALLMQSFLLVANIAAGGIESLLTFLNALIPTYALTMVFSGHAVSGAMLYELAFVLVYLVELLMGSFLKPLVHVYVLIQFLNNLFDEDKLSKLAAFLENAIGLALKTAFGGVIGLGVVQSMLTPAKDALSHNAVLSGLSAIPGIGNLVGSAGDVLLGCGLLIKNSVGVVGVLFLAFFTMVPILQIGCFHIMYQLLAVVLQPVADKRITECVSAVAKGSGLYLKMVMYTMLLFFVLISIVTLATNFVR